MKAVSCNMYFQKLLEEKVKIDSSEAAAESVIEFVPHKSTKSLAKIIRGWGKFFYDNRELPASQQGKHRKFESLIYDEDIASLCRSWIRKQKPADRSALKFRNFVRNELFPVFEDRLSENFSEITANRWLNLLGFPLTDSSKKRCSI